jgi:hypothetical protein
MCYQSLQDEKQNQIDCRDSDLTEYSEEDDNEPVTKINKKNLKEDMRNLYSFLSIGYDWWDILDQVQNGTDIIWISKLNPNRIEFTNSLRLGLQKEEYSKPRKGHDRESLKVLHRQGLRFAELAGYFNRVEIPKYNEEYQKEKEKSQIETYRADSEVRIEKFRNEICGKLPWFIIGEDGQATKKRQRRNTKKIKEWIYQDVDIDCARSDEPFDYLYRFNLTKLNYGNYLQYSVRCSSKIIDVDDDDNENSLELGGIVNDNELTRMLFKWLSMPNDELEPLQGNNYVTYRRQAILEMLRKLHD